MSLMNRQQFEQLRNLTGKRITVDIEFQEDAKTIPNLVFGGVKVENTGGLEIVLNGTYRPQIGSVTYNFVQVGIGPVCRIDVNGTIHGSAGRTHKHEMRQESDCSSRKNLPYAFARPELIDMTPRGVWELLCEEARIAHMGNFIDPPMEEQA
jgi:hypothetical protein